MQFYTLVFKNLVQRRGRSLLTLAALGLALGQFIALVGMAQGFQRAYVDLYRRHQVDLIVQRRGGAVDDIRRSVREDLAPRIARIRGVRRVVGGLLDVASCEDAGVQALVVHGLPADSPHLSSLTLAQGRWHAAGDQRRLVLGRLLARQLNKQVGDRVTLYGASFEVVGLFESPNVYENGSAILPLAELQTLTNQPGQVTSFLVTLDRSQPGLDPAEVARQIEQQGRVSAVTAAEGINSLRQIRTSRGAAWAISLVTALLGSLWLFNTLSASVAERRAEIGLLRAIGWRPARVLLLIVGESLALAAGGLVLGLALATALLAGLSRWPATALFVDGRIPPLVVAQARALALFLALIAALIPALAAARMLPQSALRQA